MKIQRLLTFALLALGRLYSQEAAPSAAAALPEKPALVFRVLSESVMRQKDGGSVTFRRVEAPLLPPEPEVVAEQPVPLMSAEAFARIQRLERKPNRMLCISASVHKGGITVLRWICGASNCLQAVSNVDFRYLTGMGSLETNKAGYSIYMSAGSDEQPLKAGEAEAAKLLPADGRPSFVLFSGDKRAASKEDVQALDAMEAMLDHFDANREELIKQHAQREEERSARELAERNAPPPPPRQVVIHFWPLQPAQREAINAQVQREASNKAALQQEALRVKGGKQ